MKSNRARKRKRGGGKGGGGKKKLQKKKGWDQAKETNMASVAKEEEDCITNEQERTREAKEGEDKKDSRSRGKFRKWGAYTYFGYGESIILKCGMLIRVMKKLGGKGTRGENSDRGGKDKDDFKRATKNTIVGRETSIFQKRKKD